MAHQKAQVDYSETFINSFHSLKDPRRISKGNIKYPLIEILFLTISSVLCGHSDYVLIEDFGKANLPWLRKFYPFKNGICSHDVIGKLFQRIDYQLFESLYSDWVKENFKLTQDELIAIDGKRICGSYDSYAGKVASHIVSAYVSSSAITLGQEAITEKSNEITAIPKLLDKIDIKNAMISIDAMGCQKAIATKIVDNGGNYFLAVKKNQKELYEQMISLLELNLPTYTDTHIWEETGHGRVEKRTSTLLTDLSLLDQKGDWSNLNCIARIDTQRYCKVKKTTSKESRYYICSSTNITAQKANEYARGHWAVENKLHWQLDVNFDEDKARKRKGDCDKNFNLILKTGLTLLERDKTNKLSIKRKKLKASYNLNYRELLMKV